MNRASTAVLGTYLVTGVVALHAVVVLAHGWAHHGLRVELTGFQTGFAGVVIVSAPLIAGFLVWTGKARLGYALLTLSMTGSLIFGVFHHYIAISPDHVAHLPVGDLRALFRLTALLLPVTEIAGAAVGIFGWNRG